MFFFQRDCPEEVLVPLWVFSVMMCHSLAIMEPFSLRNLQSSNYLLSKSECKQTLDSGSNVF